MSLEWQARSDSLAWSNPVSWWWGLLTLVSGINIAVWLVLYRELPLPAAGAASASSVGMMLLFCAAYVFGCAFRSFLPRADVQRICLFDTWLSSVMVGRTVATVAEVAFVAQWAILLHLLGSMTGAETVVNIAWVIVPLILIAECLSWYAVLTRNYLGNAIENSLWAVDGDKRLAPREGLRDVRTRRVVTRDIAEWKEEMAWMALYFSLAVWSSLALCVFYSLEHQLPPYRTGTVIESGTSATPVAGIQRQPQPALKPYAAFRVAGRFDLLATTLVSEGRVLDRFQIGAHALALAAAFALAAPIGWDREKRARSAGLRTFPLVAMASCGFIQASEGLLVHSPDGLAKVVEGLITGIGFIGGGAILKQGTTVQGTATAASLWATGAIGVSVGLGSYDVAVTVAVFTFLTLKLLTLVKEETDVTKDEAARKAD